MSSRPLTLNLSALSNEEYERYVSVFRDIADVPGPTPSSTSFASQGTSDVQLEGMQVGLREVRAWLRGRYGSGRDGGGFGTKEIDEILMLFHPRLASTDTLTGGQVFAALRLVTHMSEGGKKVDPSLAFVQAHPRLDTDFDRPPPPAPPLPAHPRPPSPPKRKFGSEFPPPPHPHHHQPPSRPSNVFKRHSYQAPSSALSPPPVPSRQMSHYSHVSPSDTSSPPNGSTNAATNPFHRPTFSSNSNKNNTIEGAAATGSQMRSVSAHNPFRSNSMSASPPKIPPLPPRKPAALSTQTPSLLTAQVSGSSGSPSQLFPPSNKGAGGVFGHRTSPLMQQSLEASKAAQSIRMAEAEKVESRFLQVLKSSSAASLSRSPPKASSPFTSGGGSSSSGSLEGTATARSRSPPKLPSRRKRTPPPVPSPSLTNMSSSSLEAVAGARVSRATSDAGSARTATRKSVEYPNGIAHGKGPAPPPPKHPDRRPSISQDNGGVGEDSSVTGWPPTPTSTTKTGISRSVSLHQKKQPPAELPLRRRRHESVQLPKSATNNIVTTPESSPFHDAHALSASARTPQSSGNMLSKHISLSMHSNGEGSPIAHLTKTFENLQRQAQPTIDKARFKAEAGLSRRGFMSRGEQEASLIGNRQGENSASASDASDDGGVGSFYDSAEEDGVDANVDKGRRSGLGSTREKDALKWPAEAGWKPLR